MRRRVAVGVWRPGDALLIIHGGNHGGVRRAVGQIGELQGRGSLGLLVQRRQVGGQQLHAGFGAVVRPVGLQVIAANLAGSLDHEQQTHRDGGQQRQNQQAGDKRKSP
jgi:hypothetical protein